VVRARRRRRDGPRGVLCRLSRRWLGSGGARSGDDGSRCSSTPTRSGCARRGRIERRCLDDVAFRVITANNAPDHATFARFRVRHEAAIAGLFGEVLALCARSGLVKVGVVAVDGTKIAAAATHHATRSYEQIAQEILEDAARIDAAEDELFGEARGDELPDGAAHER